MDITNAIMDPELGRSAFTVERLTYTRSATGTASRSQTYSALGCVCPGTPEMIRLQSEEERHKEFITIYTDFALSLGAVLDITASFYGVALGQTELDARVLALDEYISGLDKPLMLFVPVIGSASSVVASGSLLQTLSGRTANPSCTIRMS